MRLNWILFFLCMSSSLAQAHFSSSSRLLNKATVDSRSLDELVARASPGDDFGTGIDIDSAGNVYITGITFGAFPGYTNAGGEDIFIAKYTNAGVQTWLRQLGTNRDDLALSVSVDGSRRPLIAGFTMGAFAGKTSAGGQDAFIARYTTAGADSFLTQFGTPGDDRALAIKLDNSNRNFVAGTTSGAFSGFTSKGGRDAWVARFSSSGNQSWLEQFGTAGDDYAWSIGVLAGSGVNQIAGLTTGAFSGFTNQGGEDLFVTQYTAAGKFKWLAQNGTAGDDEITGAFTDDTGDTTMSGLTTGAFSGYTNAGNGDPFLIKYSSTGALTWTRQFGTAGDDYFLGLIGDSTGRSYGVGSTDAAFPGETDLNGYDIILTRYTASGSQYWIQQIGTN